MIFTGRTLHDNGTTVDYVECQFCGWNTTTPPRVVRLAELPCLRCERTTAKPHKPELAP